MAAVSKRLINKTRDSPGHRHLHDSGHPSTRTLGKADKAGTWKTWKTKQKWNKHENMKNRANQENIENQENHKKAHQTLHTQWFGHACITKCYVHHGLGTHSPTIHTYIMVWTPMAQQTVVYVTCGGPWSPKPLRTLRLVGYVCPNQCVCNVLWSMHAQTIVYVTFGAPSAGLCMFF